MESVRDQMTPKSEDDIRSSVKRKGPKKRIEVGIQMNWMDMIKDGVEEWKKKPNTISDYERSLLVSTAIRNDQTEIAEYLLDNNFHPHCERILEFIWSKKFDIVKHLIDKGVDMDGLKYSITKILTHGYGEWDEIGQILIDKFPGIKEAVEKEVGFISKNLEKYKKFL